MKVSSHQELRGLATMDAQFLWNLRLIWRKECSTNTAKSTKYMVHEEFQNLVCHSDSECKVRTNL